MKPVLSRLATQAVLLVMPPIILGFLVLLLYNRSLLEDWRNLHQRELAESNRQAQFALGQQLSQASQTASLLARSREIAQGMVDRNTPLLHSWGDRIIFGGWANEVYFVSPEGYVIARGHEDMKFNDTYSGSLRPTGAAEERSHAAILIENGRPYFGARVPVRQFDVRTVGYVALTREITPKLLGGLGVHPSVNVRLEAGPAQDEPLRTPGENVVASGFDLPADISGGSRLHLVLSRDFSEEAERLHRRDVALWITGALALLLLPAGIGWALYRLLQPARKLHERLTDFSRDASNPGGLVADIESLAGVRNELGAIARAMVETLKALQTAQSDLVQAQKLAALGAMVASITHEINTPLGNSLIAATTLRDRAAEITREIGAGIVRRSSLEKFLGECAEATGILERNLDRAGSLMASFKHVAVDQTGAGRREFFLNEVVHDVLLTLRPSFKRLPIRIVEEIPPGISMNSFPGALGQVLTNLVQNAAFHGLEGMARGEVRVTAESLAGRAAIRVRDDGRGITPQNMVRIFEPFFTTKAGRGGSGLGLHICRKLVGDVLGGTITAHSVPGEGATFTLDLPLDVPVEGGDRRRPRAVPDESHPVPSVIEKPRSVAS